MTSNAQIIAKASANVVGFDPTRIIQVILCEYTRETLLPGKQLLLAQDVLKSVADCCFGENIYSFNRIFANMGALHCANYAKINKSLEKNCRSYKMY